MVIKRLIRGHPERRRMVERLAALDPAVEAPAQVSKSREDARWKQ